MGDVVEPWNDCLRIEKAVYGGDGLLHDAGGNAVFVPYALPRELIRFGTANGLVEIVEPSPDRVAPGCVHFGACGGCQYQMASYPAQLGMKKDILRETLRRAGVFPGLDLPATQVVGSPEPWGYRNRIRLRVRRVEGVLRLGYNLRGSETFLPVRMCPIAAPLLWRAAEAVVDAAVHSNAVALWLGAASEIELFCDGDETKLQLQLGFLEAAPKPARGADFPAFAEAVRAGCPELAGAGAVRLDPRSGQVRETLAAWGAEGLAYTVHGESYWVARGGFFQVNRFLLPKLVKLVCDGRRGGLAWDLFAGVGLFSRALARSFNAVTAVEANPGASAEARRALAKLGPQHTAVNTTTLDFLRRAVPQRDRPDLLVLDPPRAGAGAEACALIARLAPAEIVYVSCDPTTLARDLAVLTDAGYLVADTYLVDLFPQTYHLETVMVLRRGNVAH